MIETEDKNNDSNIIDELKEKDNIHSTEKDNIQEETINENSQTNCLALTIRKDYNLIIAKNFITTTGRISWKIVLSTFVLNFLRMFL